MWTFLGRFLRDGSGASALDYGLIGAVISLVIVAAVAMIGGDLDKPFQSIITALRGGIVHR